MLIFAPDSFGYVDFENEEAASKAVQIMNQQVFEGRRLIVQPAIIRGTPRLSRGPQPLRNSPSRTIYIGNLSFDLTDRDLNNLFKDFKDVVDVRVAIDRRTGQPRGFAHADFTSTESAQAALNDLQGKLVNGRELKCDYSSSLGRASMINRDEPKAQTLESF